MAGRVFASILADMAEGKSAEQAAQPAAAANPGGCSRQQFQLAQPLS